VDAVTFLFVEALVAGDDPLTLDDLWQRPPWMADALCREFPEVSWFPGRGEDVRPAKAICARCLVAEECAAFVASFDAHAAEHGIWGGLSARERRRSRAA
jgi:hypothetical protein